MNKFLLLLFSYVLISCSPKTDSTQTKQLIPGEHKRKLLVIENAFYTENGKLHSYPHFITYNFENGLLVSKDTLTTKEMNLANFKDMGAHYDNFVYKNRYAISPLGGAVYDYKTNTLLLDEKDFFVEAIGDSLIFHRNNVYRGNGYFLFDLKTHTYTLLKNKSYTAVEGILSPDKKHGIKTNWGIREYPIKHEAQLILFDSLNNKTTLVTKGGIGTCLSSFSSDLPEIPVFWIDNSSFIYAKYLFPDVNKKTSIELRKININSKSDEKLCMLDTVKNAGSNARFFKNAAGDIIFEHADIPYQFTSDLKHLSKIDSKSQQLFMPLGYNFECEVPYDWTQDELRFNHKAIGKIQYYYEAKTSEGYIAFHGIKVWSTYSNEWTSITSPWLKCIIGWVED